MPELILASASPRRRQLLASLGLKFRVEVAQVEEWEAGDADPASLVRHNAALKADAVSARNPAALVIAADTTVALAGRVYNKPADLAAARAMLRALGGRTHHVYTAVSLRHGAGRRASDFVEVSCVTFRPLDDAAIDHYFTLTDPLDKAGAYGIQDGAEWIVEHFAGSRSNIMGLPLERLAGELRGWIPPAP
jgi:septum formation protein